MKRIQESSKDYRLYFIRYLYRGMSVEEASDLVGVTKATGYTWLKRWNVKRILKSFGMRYALSEGLQEAG